MTDDELIAKAEKEFASLTRCMSPDKVAKLEAHRLIALARIGASVMPRPISEANIETGLFIAFVDVTSNKTGETWTEKHIVWLDEDTGEIAVDCEQGWRFEDYQSFIPLSALPQVKP